MTPALECENLCVSFDSVLAVDDLSFTVEAGEVLGLLGPNGAGKTTTIRVVTTLLDPDSGSARVFGVDTRRDSMRVRRMIGYVPQRLSADGSLTGYENVWLYTRLYDVPSGQRRVRATEALASMGLAGAASRLAATYSGGMIRRLELAQALVNRPRLLILDEPTIGLDPVARSDVWERVRTLREETGMTVLLTTHYMEEADELCDQVVLMHNGALQAFDRPQALKAGLGDGASLEDVFRHFTGDDLDEQGAIRDVRTTRRTAGRLG